LCTGILSRLIYITNDGVVKILDFGLAKLKGQTTLTKEGTTLGTVAYMSPEQVQGLEIDQRVDIWSLGVILYEMITGKLPFKGDYEQAVMYSVINMEPVPLAKLRSGVPSELEKIAAKAMAKSPDIRYQHMEDLKAEIDKLEEYPGSGTALSAKTGSLSTKEPVKRSLPGRVMIIVAGCIAAVFIIFFMQRILRKERESPFHWVSSKSIAVLPFSALSGTVEDVSFSDGIHDDILTQLTKIGDLKVIARTSVIQYRNTQKRIRDIAKELGVSSILEGTVRKEGNQIRIGAQLIDAKSENHLWAETYDREYSDVFAIQSDVAQKIALYSRNYPKALSILEADTTCPHYYSVLQGQLLELLGEHIEAKAKYEFARSLSEKLVKESPENAYHYTALGLAFAGLGDKGRAIECGQKAIEIHPIQSDPWSSGEEILLEFAHINIIVGEYEKAIDQIETLLSIPSQLTKWRLKLDPIYDPLRGEQRFQKIIGEK
jgi:TolB-like protein